MEKKSADKPVSNILFASSSVIYRRIVKNVFSDLLPNAALIFENTEASALSRLEEFTADLIIIDTAIIIDEGGFSDITSAYPDIPEVLLCSQKEHEYYYSCNHDRIGEKLHLIVKPINEDYSSNLKAIKRGLRLALVKLFGETQEESQNNPLSAEDKSEQNYSILLIAASTGGTVAMERIFSALPKKLNLPVLIVQHMPPVFTKKLADSLSKQFSINITEASNGDDLENEKILLAPGGYHMLVDKHKKIALGKGEPVNGVKPSADVLFFSVAEQFRGEKVLAVILTGMGSDGTEGVRALKKACKCFCIAQDEESCTVYGMPRAIVEAGLHDRLISLDSISGLISRKLRIDSSGEEDF